MSSSGDSRYLPPGCGLRVALEVGEHGMVPNRPGSPPQDSVAKFAHHEGLLRYVIFAAERQANRRKKTEAWIIRWVPQYDHSGCVESPALLKALADQS